MSPRMSRLTLIILPIVALSLACSQQKPAPFEPEDHSVRDDREAPFNPPERYPEWAFDQPEFVKPAAPDQPAPAARAGDPNHFFTNKRVVMVEQPSGYTPEETPRIAIYYTNDNGFHWKKAGYFGREQSFFPLETEDDGDYGVNFVGPGQKPEEHTPAYPARMYHVDTMLPEVTVNIDPEKTWYNVGDDIRISWEAKDPHLEQFPVRIGMLMDFTASEHDLIELQRDLPDDGAIDYRISSETEGHEIVIRVEALDRAGNLGLAYSHALQIQERTDDQIISKARRHHDDRIRAARHAAPVTRTAGPQPPVTITPTKCSPSSEPMREAGSAKAEPKPKTRVKVITVGRADLDDTDSSGNAAPMTTAEPSMHDTDDVTPMSSRSAEEDDDEITTLLDCKEREAYERAITPTDVEPEPVAADTTPSRESKKTPARTMTIHDALEPLKDAIGKISDLKRPTQKQDTATASTPATRDTPKTPIATTTSDVAKPAVAHAAPVQPTRPASSRNTARPIASTSPTPIDPTRGSGLVAPMPGTVSDANAGNAASHPWRSLGAGDSTANARTWTLPEAKAAVSAKPIGEPQAPTGGPVLVEARDAEELPAD